MGAVTMMYFVSRQIVRPLLQLGDSARKFGEGDYETAIAITCQDEVGQLATVLDGARQEIDGFITRILDNIPGLLLSVDKNGIIMPHVSQQVIDALGADCVGKNVNDRLFAGSALFKEAADIAFDPQFDLPFTDSLALAERERTSVSAPSR